MARSAREIIDDHIGGGQAKLVRYRREYSGSGEYVPATEQAKREQQLLESLLNARDVLEQAEFGFDDPQFRAAVERWAASEWGGWRDRLGLTRTPLPRPEKREHLRRRAA